MSFTIVIIVFIVGFNSNLLFYRKQAQRSGQKPASWSGKKSKEREENKTEQRDIERGMEKRVRKMKYDKKTIKNWRHKELSN